MTSVSTADDAERSAGAPGRPREARVDRAILEAAY